MEHHGEHSSVIYGTHFPNRLFIGCLPPEASCDDLGAFFQSFGEVKEAKVILDVYKNSKRFGFVAFAKKEDAESVLRQGDIYMMGKKINVGPAIKREGKKLKDVPVCIIKPQSPPASRPQKVPRYTYSFVDTTTTSAPPTSQGPSNQPTISYSTMTSPPIQHTQLSYAHDQTRVYCNPSPAMFYHPDTLRCPTMYECASPMPTTIFSLPQQYGY